MIKKTHTQSNSFNFVTSEVNIDVPWESENNYLDKTKLATFKKSINTVQGKFLLKLKCGKKIQEKIQLMQCAHVIVAFEVGFRCLTDPVAFDVFLAKQKTKQKEIAKK